MQFHSRALVIFLFLFTGLSCSPTKAAETTKPVLHSEPERAAESVNTVPAFKKSTANEVFKSLKTAVGLSPSDPPSFELVDVLPGNFASAMISYQEQKIYLEEAAYDICTKFFKADSLDALASYLGHELAHYRANHEVKNHYTWEFKDDLFSAAVSGKKINLPQKDKNEIIKLLFYSLTSSTEVEADLDGGFLAYLAGYKTLGIGEELLQRTYDTFGIKPEPENKDYPTLEERKKIVRETEKELSSLISLFETGNLLMAVGQYESALICHEAILKRFQSREIYNNIGVLNALVFLDKVDQKKVRFAFPLELDLESRLDATRNIEEEALSFLLDAALTNFQAAIAKDPDYIIGHLNVANVHGLMTTLATDQLLKDKHFAMAEAYSLSALVLAEDQKASNKIKADIEILRGILDGMQSDNTSAEAHFNKALGLLPDYALAKDNLSFLAGNSPSRPFDPASLEEFKLEKIENVAFARLKASPIFKDSLNNKRTFITIYEGKKQVGNSRTLQQSRLLSFRKLDKRKGPGSDQSVSFHITDALSASSGLSTQKGIKPGDDRSAITATTAYGKPSKEVQLGQGSWLIYQNYSLIFELDEQQKLRRWAVYKFKL